VGAIIDELGRIGSGEAAPAWRTRAVHAWGGSPMRAARVGADSCHHFDRPACPLPCRDEVDGEAVPGWTTCMLGVAAWTAGAGAGDEQRRMRASWRECECRNFPWRALKSMVQCTVYLEPRLLDLQSKGPKYTTPSLAIY
jgi:hypothetical protein